MAVERRHLVLGGAAVVVLVLAVTLMWPASRAATPSAPVTAATPARSGSGRAAGANGQPASAVAPVKLQSLSDARDQPGEGRRNPFRYQPKAAPPPPKPVVTAPPVNTDPRPLPPPGPPPAPPIPLKLIGVLERANGVKWAVLSDGKNAPVYGKDGDIVDGRYQIVKIGTESVEMTYADGRGRTVIRLTGQ